MSESKSESTGLTSKSNTNNNSTNSKDKITHQLSSKDANQLSSKDVHRLINKEIDQSSIEEEPRLKRKFRKSNWDDSDKDDESYVEPSGSSEHSPEQSPESEVVKKPTTRLEQKLNDEGRPRVDSIIRELIRLNTRQGYLINLVTGQASFKDWHDIIEDMEHDSRNKFGGRLSDYRYRQIKNYQREAYGLMGEAINAFHKIEHLIFNISDSLNSAYHESINSSKSPFTN